MGSDERIEQLKSLYLKRVSGSLVARCESPIEEMFMWAALAEWHQEFGGGVPSDDATRTAAVRFGLNRMDWDGINVAALGNSYFGSHIGAVDVALLMQVPVDRFRVDFAVFVSPHEPTFQRPIDAIDAPWRKIIKLGVELDGHQFHEKNKEQAARDKGRDRTLTAAGWRMLRFTGSEIYADASRCAAEVCAAIKPIAIELAESLEEAIRGEELARAFSRSAD